jgi:hypothetical protein
MPIGYNILRTNINRAIKLTTCIINYCSSLRELPPVGYCASLREPSATDHARERWRQFENKTTDYGSFSQKEHISVTIFFEKPLYAIR